MFLVIIFFWVVLAENLFGEQMIFYSFGNGLDVRLSLIMKIGFLIANVFYLLNQKVNVKSFKHFFIFSLFIFVSCLYVLFISPGNFFSSLSVTLHIILMLNIALFVYLFGRSPNSIHFLLSGLRFFGLINAVLVIVSYIKPDLTQLFEAGTYEGEFARAFGIMGDEVSTLLIFFSFDAMVRKKYLPLLVYCTAFLCTGSIGATLSLIFLFAIYYFRNFKFQITSLVALVVSLFLFLGVGFVFRNQLSNISVVQRIDKNINNPEKGSGNLRFVSLVTAFEMFQERPILGYGYGNYQNAVRKKFEPIFIDLDIEYRFPSAMVIMSSAFNPFVQVVCEAGIIGLLFFLFFIFATLKYLRKVYKIEKEDEFGNNQSTIIYFWAISFLLTTVSANWLLPSSFLFLLFVVLFGVATVIEFNEPAQNKMSAYI